MKESGYQRYYTADIRLSKATHDITFVTLPYYLNRSIRSLFVLIFTAVGAHT